MDLDSESHKRVRLNDEHLQAATSALDSFTRICRELNLDGATATNIQPYIQVLYRFILSNPLMLSERAMRFTPCGSIFILMRIVWVFVWLNCWDARTLSETSYRPLTCGVASKYSSNGYLNSYPVNRYRLNIYRIWRLIGRSCSKHFLFTRTFTLRSLR